MSEDKPPLKNLICNTSNSDAPPPNSFQTNNTEAAVAEFSHDRLIGKPLKKAAQSNHSRAGLNQDLQTNTQTAGPGCPAWGEPRRCTRSGTGIPAATTDTKMWLARDGINQERSGGTDSKTSFSFR